MKMEEKKSYWHTARDWFMGAAAVILTAVGAKYVAEKILQDKKQQTSEWRSGEVNGTKVVYDAKSGLIHMAFGSKEQLDGLGYVLSQEQMDSLEVERIKESNDKIDKQTWYTDLKNPKDMRITVEGQTFDFDDAADAVRAKSENLQQKKKGTDTPAPQPNAAEDQNRDAVLPKQAKLTSTRSKGGRKGGESLGA